MFTGIIETTGVVQKRLELKDSVQITIQPKKSLKPVKIGESIAVNGVCLTVLKKTAKALTFDIVHETLRLTTFSRLKTNSIVNMERALKYGDRLSGHYVMGHIEAMGEVKSIQKTKQDITYTIAYPKKLAQRIFPKASITIDGISLTLGAASHGAFKIHIIPHTLQITHLKQLSKGDKVNLETDILLRCKKSLFLV